MIEYYEDKEKEELERLYPEGSPEHRVLEYSKAKKHHDEVPPMLKAAFKVLMGVTVLMAVVGLVGFLSH